MSFQLTIAEGKEAGKELSFEQDSVLIGRVTECDVVLYDAGISRRHCRIFSEGGQYSVEDLGSSNGTRLNGEIISGKQVLGDGDQISLGGVVFVFRPMEGGAAEEEPPPSADSTRIVSLEAMSRPRGRTKSEVLVPAGAAPEELAEARLNATRPHQALKPRGTAARPGPPASGAPPRPSRAGGSAAIERAPASAPASRRPAPSAVARPVSEAPGSGLSAAERARIKRESSGVAAQFKLFWLDASPNMRRGLIGAALVMALGVMGTVFWLVLSGDQKVARGPEPVTLNRKPIADSFGLGDDVTWEHADQKVFEWEYTAATRALGLLRFQSQGISEGEVLVTVNGVDVGKVAADTLASGDRFLDIMIPAQLLKKGETNRIVFDNTKNPPGDDTWRIWNLSLEKVLLPEIPPEQLVEEARKAYSRGRKNMETAEVGARNRYEAWKSFREAWLLLEAHPEPKPDLYFESRERVKETQKELDRVCAKLMLEVESYSNKENWQAASSTLDHIREYFPDDYDQSCAHMAEVKRANLGL